MPANVPVTEVVHLDAVLDALDDPSSSEVYSAVEAFSDTAIAAAAVARALAGGGGGGSPTLTTYARLSIQGGVGGSSGADVLVAVSGVAGFSSVDGMAFTGPSTFPAAFICSPWVQLGEDLGDATLELNYAEYMVSNGAGTEKLRIELDVSKMVVFDVEGARRNSMPFADCSVTQQIGSDLSLVSFDAANRIPATGIAGIQSAAGGEFFNEFLVTLVYTAAA